MKKGTLNQALRNLPGVEYAQVDHLNLLQLAPGGHLGRFIIWTKDAFAKLDSLYGSHSSHSQLKKGFHFPHSKMANADLGRLLKSDEIRSVLRERQSNRRNFIRKKNPLTNLGFLIKLNPYAIVQRRRAILENARNAKKNLAARADPKKAPKRHVKKPKKPVKKAGDASKKPAAQQAKGQKGQQQKQVQQPKQTQAKK